MPVSEQLFIFAPPSFIPTTATGQILLNFTPILHDDR
jgi:hypothetical protein